MLAAYLRRRSSNKRTRRNDQRYFDAALSLRAFLISCVLFVKQCLALRDSDTEVVGHRCWCCGRHDFCSVTFGSFAVRKFGGEKIKLDLKNEKGVTGIHILCENTQFWSLFKFPQNTILLHSLLNSALSDQTKQDFSRKTFINCRAYVIVCQKLQPHNTSSLFTHKAKHCYSTTLISQL